MKAGLWNTLPKAKRERIAPSPIQSLSSLIAAHHFHQAMDIWNRSGALVQLTTQTSGHILDRGFEDNLAHGPGAVFGWQVQSNCASANRNRCGPGSYRQSSLRLYFQVRSHIDTIDVSQLVPVKPNTEYDFECYVKTEGSRVPRTPGDLDRQRGR